MNLKYKLLIVVVLLNICQINCFKKHFLSKSHHSEETDFCPQPVYRSDEQFQDLMDKIQEQSMSDDKFSVIQEEVPQNPFVFNTDQIIQILNEVTFVSIKVKTIEFLRPYITGISTQEIQDILDNIGFTSDKLKVLKALAPVISDISDDNKEIIIESFGFSSDMKKARKILENIVSIDCIFGAVSEKSLAFIIDISGSMDYTFTTDDGGYMTRLDFVKQHLTYTIGEKLQDYQSFNIFTLYQYADQWQSDAVQVNSDNIDAGLAYINRLQVKGYTNLSYPLKKVFENQQNLDAIYLLSDGSPNYGIQDLDQLTEYVQNLVDSRDGKVTINTISFMLGGRESSTEREKAQGYLEMIAQVGKGSFRQLN